MQNAGSGLDVSGIRDLYGQIAITSAAADKQGWLDCWSEAAVWTTDHFICSGRSEIGAQWEAIWENFDRVVVLNEIGGFQPSKDGVRVTCCVLEIVRMKNGATINMAGIYRDEVVQQSGAWRFASRTYEAVSPAPAA